jgi:hypothetical protein
VATTADLRNGIVIEYKNDLYKVVEKSAEAGDSLKQAYDKAMVALQPRYGNWVIFEHCMPFDVSRAYDGLYMNFDQKGNEANFVVRCSPHCEQNLYANPNRTAKSQTFRM